MGSYVRFLGLIIGIAATVSAAAEAQSVVVPNAHAPDVRAGEARSPEAHPGDPRVAAELKPAYTSPFSALSAVARNFSGALIGLHDPSQRTEVTKPAALPWNQRFTFGSQFHNVEDKWALSQEVVAGQADLSARWGVTLVQRSQVNPTPAPKDWLAAGAFYNLTPRVRFGGEVSVSSKPGTGDLRLGAPQNADKGVKLEGALRF